MSDKVNWKTYDKWHLSTKEIVADTGVTRARVTFVRKKYAPETIGQHAYDWASVDWGKRTATIAKELGISKTSVSNARRRYAPATKSDWRTTQRKASVYRAEKEFLDQCED